MLDGIQPQSPHSLTIYHKCPWPAEMSGGRRELLDVGVGHHSELCGAGDLHLHPAARHPRLPAHPVLPSEVQHPQHCRRARRSSSLPTDVAPGKIWRRAVLKSWGPSCLIIIHSLSKGWGPALLVTELSRITHHWPLVWPSAAQLLESKMPSAAAG